MPALTAAIPRGKTVAGAPPARTSALPELLSGVAGQVEELRDLHQVLDVTVLRARANGATWRALADVLGMTHQGARRRYLP